MPAFLGHKKRTVAAALAGPFLFLLGLTNPCVAAPESNPTLTATAADLGAITGAPVEIHATALITADRSLPLICQTVTAAFRDAAADPATKERLGKIVHVVVIQGWFAGGGMHHVKLKDQVMTIETLTDPRDVQDLRPLIVEVLKKVAALDTKRKP